MMENDVADDESFEIADYEEDSDGVELTSAVAFAKCDDDELDDYILADRVTPSGWLDEDYEAELGFSIEECSFQELLDVEFGDIARLGILQTAGEDKSGRRLIVFNGCRLPDFGQIDHTHLLNYLKKTLEQYVSSDYAILYFHRGVTRLNRPSLSFLTEAYRNLDRKFKKNLKALYLVHPSTFLRLIIKMFQPIISSKFDRKIVHIYALEDLDKHVFLDRVAIPKRVCRYDMELKEQLMLSKYSPGADPCVAVDKVLNDMAWLAADSKFQTQRAAVKNASLRRKAQAKATKNRQNEAASLKEVTNEKKMQIQFGTSLEQIKDNFGSPMAPVLRDALQWIRTKYLKLPNIFRRTADPDMVDVIQHSCNQGKPVNFATVKDPHVIAVVVKIFLHQLTEPLIPFSMFSEVIKMYNLPLKARIVEMGRNISEELPENNYEVLKQVISLLREICEHTKENGMTPANIASIFGSILIRNKRPTNISVAIDVRTTSFVELLLTEFNDIFRK